MYKLTVTKCMSRLGLAKVIRTLKPELPFGEIPRIIEGLAVENYVLEDRLESSRDIDHMLIGIAEFTYVENPIEPGSEYVPFEERIEYKQAKQWYDTLSPEHKENVTILIGASAPRG